MTTKQVGDFTVTAVSDGVLYTTHDVVLGVDKDDSARLTGIPYGQPLPLDVNSFLIRHRDKLILSDAGTGQALQPIQKNLGKLPENLRAIGVDPAAASLGVAGRVALVGHLDDAALAAHLGRCRAVCFPPLGEDYGFVTVEAFASSKAVITCSDSGGPAELVRDGESGLVCEPTPASLAGALARVMEDRVLAERLGRGAAAQVAGMRWPDAVKRLVIV